MKGVPMAKPAAAYMLEVKTCQGLPPVHSKFGRAIHVQGEVKGPGGGLRKKSR